MSKHPGHKQLIEETMRDHVREQIAAKSHPTVPATEGAACAVCGQPKRPFHIGIALQAKDGTHFYDEYPMNRPVTPQAAPDSPYETHNVEAPDTEHGMSTEELGGKLAAWAKPVEPSHERFSFGCRCSECTWPNVAAPVPPVEAGGVIEQLIFDRKVVESERDSLAETLRQVRETLGEHQWDGVTNKSLPMCVNCGNTKSIGHVRNCWLSATLASLGPVGEGE